ncbi:MAG: ECF-type riboflavin transporter substrate-binding protein [Clostridiales Family XIII bacterium]|jgi:energy-coupling factor transport system substrate-specific component|nr:ECF-type riboflavin transporter substrate-binding protein [Clostridiales Family XIII bacterium]
MEEKKKLFQFKTSTIVAVGVGGAIFWLLFMFVKVPSPIPETSFQTAYGIAGFFGALFGPIAGGLIAFIGHAISDAVQYGSPWWSWVIASGVTGFIYGISFKFLKVGEGKFGVKGILIYNAVQIAANAAAWILVAPILDIVVYAEPVSLVFTQGAIAFVMNSISAGVIGTGLLAIYAATRTKEGSLNKE